MKKSIKNTLLAASCLLAFSCSDVLKEKSKDTNTSISQNAVGGPGGPGEIQPTAVRNTTIIAATPVNGNPNRIAIGKGIKVAWDSYQSDPFNNVRIEIIDASGNAFTIINTPITRPGLRNQYPYADALDRTVTLLSACLPFARTNPGAELQAGNSFLRFTPLQQVNGVLTPNPSLSWQIPFVLEGFNNTATVTNPTGIYEVPFSSCDPFQVAWDPQFTTASTVDIYFVLTSPYNHEPRVLSVPNTGVYQFDTRTPYYSQINNSPEYVFFRVVDHNNPENFDISDIEPWVYTSPANCPSQSQ